MPAKFSYASTADLAIRAHVLAADPELLSEIPERDRVIQELADLVNLTEAPEDAVCALVTDLLLYCEREKIDWAHDVMLRARRYIRHQRANELQAQ